MQNENGNANTDNEHGDDDNENDEDDEPEAIFNIPPPPEGNYPNLEELEKAMHAWSLEQGYEMVRRASKRNASGHVYKRYYHCSKHGARANTGKLTDATRRRPKRESNRQGCPMSLAAVAVEPQNAAGEWQIRHRKTHHNHGPLDVLSLAGHRRRARMGGVEKAVDGLFAIGSTTTQVLQFLQRTNPEGLFTRTDVSNMKLKYKKYGTCAQTPANAGRDPSEKFSYGKTACIRCRSKKQKCDAARPQCGQCIALNPDDPPCEYDYEPPPPRPQQQDESQDGTPLQDGTPSAPNTTTQFAAPTPFQHAARPRGRPSHPMPVTVPHETAQQILHDLQSFHAEHVKPKRLEVNSSTVEVLAQSSCGNGDTYKTLPILTAPSDWPTWSEAFMAASRMENTLETLLGVKTEPPRPQPPEEGQEVEVEEWNEYVKQLAIYKRRNSLLLGCFWTALAQSFRTRISGFKTASEAWRALEDMCAPRGSSEAFQVFDTLLSVSLENCGGVMHEYIAQFEAAYASFAKVKTNAQFPYDRAGRVRIENVSSRTLLPRSGGDLGTEDMACFLFLRGLGEGHRSKVEQTLLTNNVGGFGTGYKLSFQELVKRAGEWTGVGRKGR